MKLSEKATATLAVSYSSLLLMATPLTYRGKASFLGSLNSNDMSAIRFAGMRNREHTLRAKKTEAPRNSGGSPTALEECAWGVRLQGASRSSVTRRSSGMSFAVGILYVPACKGFALKDLFSAASCFCDVSVVFAFPLPQELLAGLA